MNNVMTKDQGTSILERMIYGVALALAMKFVAWGWLDADMAPYIAAGIVAAVGSAYAWWINRPVSIVQAASNLVDPNTGKKTQVVTSPELAAATPGNPNIVSQADNKVVSK